MAYDWKQEIYWRLPIRIQEAALSVYARRLERIYYGPGYEEFKTWIAEAVAAGPEFIEGWQDDRLRYIVTHAARLVPYYRERFRGLPWDKVRSKADLHMLPVLEKQSIRRNEGAFVAEGERLGSLWVEKTSGTTGTLLKIYWPWTMPPQWWATTEVLVRHVAGVSQDMPRAMVGGRPVVPGATCTPPYWRFNRRWNQLYFSSYHISRNTAAAYIGALKKYRSTWMTGYGSAIAALAQNAREEEIEPYSLKAVIVSGDTLVPGMRQCIEEFFQCKCFDHYGQCEGVAMAMECEHGRMHIIPTVGIIEILREDGSACGPGEVGEIVATSLLNDAMPFIRYRMGDLAAWAVDQTCPCGNMNRILSNVEGRVDDYLILADGRSVGRLAAFRVSSCVHSAQLVQDDPGHAFLLVRPGEGYSSSDSAEICDSIRNRIGKFNVDVVEVSEIPKTPQGKTKLVVRLFDRPELRGLYEALLR